jgi:Peptidase family S41
LETSKINRQEDMKNIKRPQLETRNDHGHPRYVVAGLLLGMILLGQIALGQSVTKPLYSVVDLKSDFNIFRSALEEGHPGIYRYNSKGTMNSIFDAAEISITRPMGEREFKILLSKITSQIGCGHLAVLAPKIDQDKFDKEATAIPFQPYYSDGRLSVLTNFSEIQDNGFVGARIMSINGHSTSDILKAMFAIMPADGNNKTYKYRNLTYSRYFTRYFYFLYGDTAFYTVEYSSGAGVKTAKLAGLPFGELNAIRDKKYPRHFLSDPLEFKLEDDKKTAYLKIESFDGDVLEQKQIDFPKFLQSAFNRIDSNKIKTLIIDLRNNHGGTDEFGKLLFSYLIPHDFEYYSSLTTSTDSYGFFKYTNMPSPRVPSGMLKGNAAGTFDVVRHPNVGKQKPLLPTYSGKIYVLINGGCFSTASECISMIHANTDAVFIGEESGGGYYGNNSGMVPEMTLPNTTIRIAIPLMKYVMAVKDYQFKDHGLFPNYEVIPKIEDKINGHDPELEFAHKLINK